MRVKEQDSGLKRKNSKKQGYSEWKKKSTKNKKGEREIKKGVEEQVIDWKEIFLAHCQELKPPNMLREMKRKMR